MSEFLVGMYAGSAIVIFWRVVRRERRLHWTLNDVSFVLSMLVLSALWMPICTLIGLYLIWSD